VSERERVAEELRRVRDAVRDRALAGAPAGRALPAHREVSIPGPMPPDDRPPPPKQPPRPDNADLNRLWTLRGALEQGGLRRVVARGLGRLLARLIDRQEAFNSRQVQFDNALLDYIDARLEETHRHYDAVLGIHGRHMGEIDERHLIMQEELVAHVHDLVKRIDLVLGESERGRLGLEFALRDMRARLLRLEEHASAGAGAPSGGKRAGGAKHPQPRKK
jgi:hypothetical protein